VVEFWSARRKLWCMKEADRDTLLRHYEAIVQKHSSATKWNGDVRWLQLGPETMIASLDNVPGNDHNPVRDALKQEAWEDYFELLAFSQNSTTSRKRTVFPDAS